MTHELHTLEPLRPQLLAALTSLSTAQNELRSSQQQLQNVQSQLAALRSELSTEQSMRRLMEQRLVQSSGQVQGADGRENLQRELVVTRTLIAISFDALFIVLLCLFRWPKLQCSISQSCCSACVMCVSVVCLERSTAVIVPAVLWLLLLSQLRGRNNQRRVISRARRRRADRTEKSASMHLFPAQKTRKQEKEKKRKKRG